jgi:hypothetical protein
VASTWYYGGQNIGKLARDITSSYDIQLRCYLDLGKLDK